MTPTISANATGVWAKAESAAVELIGYSSNGRAARVRLATDVCGYKAGRVVTLPAKWIEGAEPEPPAAPARCPACGRELEETP